MQRKNELLVLGVLFLFAMLTAVRHLSSQGSDLSSSYCACSLLASGQPNHIYDRDPRNYDEVNTSVWTQVGLAAGLYHEKQIHPYVQTPLWAWSLQPLCTHMKFPPFNVIFLVFTSFCMSAAIWLVARYWTPRLLHPGAIALICAGLYLTEAYKYAMVLTQTHIIFVLLTFGALLCSRRGQHPIWAGALLALAAAVKITPGFLLLYWLVNRQWRASISFVGFSTALAAASILTTGLPLNLLYLHNLSSISNILLVSYNNQSLAGLWMSGMYPLSEQHSFHSLPLPAVLKWTSTLLCLGSTLAGGLLDRRADQEAKSSSAHLPYGAAFAMVGATVFTPIAWTHYYIILIFPLMLLLDAEMRTKSRLLLATLLLVFAFNFDFQTLGGFLRKYELFPIVHAQFFSGLVCMAGLVFASLTVDRRALSTMPKVVGERVEASH